MGGAGGEKPDGCFAARTRQPSGSGAELNFFN